MSAIFVGIFIFLLPFGMVTEFHKLGEVGPCQTRHFSFARLNLANISEDGDIA